MIDRTFLPRRRAATRWPDYDVASPAAICAPISGLLGSPRGIPSPDKGYIMAPKTLAAKVARVRAAYRQRKNNRKLA